MTDSPLLTKEQILSGRDRPHEDIDLPELGGRVRIRRMSAHEREAMAHYLQQLDEKKQSGEDVPTVTPLAVVACYSIVDGENRRMFTIEDFKRLSQCDDATLEKIWHVADRLNAFSARAQEALEKN
jgi:hypothetical protein